MFDISWFLTKYREFFKEILYETLSVIKLYYNELSAVLLYSNLDYLVVVEFATSFWSKFILENLIP